MSDMLTNSSSRVISVTSSATAPAGAPSGITLNARGANTPNAVPTNCNRTLAATWGMVLDGNTLQMIDQSGTRWKLDYSGTTPRVTMLHEVGRNQSNNFWIPAPGPWRTLRKVTLPSPAAGAKLRVSAPLPFVGTPPDVTAEFPYAMAFAMPNLAQEVLTWPFEQDSEIPRLGVPDPIHPWISYGSTSIPTPHNPIDDRPRHHLYWNDGFIAFSKTGDVLALPSGGSTHVCWWTGDGRWPNRLQGFYGNATDCRDWWSTAGGLSLPTSGTSSASTIIGHDLRNHVASDMAEGDCQALRLFTDPVANEQRIAVFTPGARLMVLERATNDTTIGNAPLESDAFDYGHGGMALAVGPPHGGNTLVDLYCGALAYYAMQPLPGATQPQDMVSVIARVEYQGNATFSSATLAERQRLVLDGTNGQPKVYGVCGMTVGDLLTSNGSHLELIVGALDGHLLVYDVDPNSGAISPTPLYVTQVEGAVGAFNSFVIADLDNDAAGKRELYAATSVGLRKWVQP